MNNKNIILVLLLTILIAGCNSNVEKFPEKPNIILIITDDMGFSDIGLYGGEIETPNLDFLGTHGMRFSQFYNCGKCEPSRAAITTGHYYQVNIHQKWKKKLPCFGDLMQQAGYRTMMVGKWHAYGNTWERGFDRTFGHMGGATDFFKGDKTFQLDGKKWKIPQSGFYNTDANTDFAIQFIKEEKEKHPDQPFFLYLGYNAPHSPIQALPEDIAKYRGKYRKGWDVIREDRFRRQQKTGLMKPEWNMTKRPESIHDWESLSEKEKDFEDLRMAIYAAMIDRVDQGVGRIMDQLKEMGVEDNTLIMFVNDNGGSPFDRVRGRGKEINTPGSHWNVGLGWANCSNTPYKFYKRTQHNGGNATPFIAYWPEVIDPADNWFDEKSHIIDIMPTLLDLAGAKYPDQFNNTKLPALKGKSLVNYFKGEEREPHDTLFFSLFRNHAIIKGDWKLVSAYCQPWALYNLTEDRTETTDMFSAETEKAKELMNIWEEYNADENIKMRIPATNQVEPKRQLLFDADGNLMPPQPEPITKPNEMSP